MKVNGWNLSFALVALFFIGCGAPYATMRTDGLHYRDYNIQVLSISKHKPRFVNGSWSMENWLEQQSDKSWRRKKAAPYQGDVIVDIYANGNPKKVKDYYYELFLDHDGSISSLIVDVATASSQASERSMEDLYKIFVENMAAKEPWYAGKRFEKSHVDKQAKVVPGNFKVVKVLDYDAVVGYVERSEYDSNEKNGNMAYAIFLLKLTDIATVNRTKELKGTQENIPIVLSVVLEAEPAERDSLVDDFYELLGQIQVKGTVLNVEYVAPTGNTKSVCEKIDGDEESQCPAADDESKEMAEEDIIGPKRVRKQKQKKKKAGQ